MATFDDRFNEEEQSARLSDYDLQLVEWRGVLGEDEMATDWLIEPVLARGRGHALYAPAKAGKSLLALGIAAAVASGRAYLHRMASEPVSVLYVDYEMTVSDVRARVLDMGYEAEDLATLHYLLNATLPPLDTTRGGEHLAGFAEHLKAELVVIDTTGRAISGSENDADTFLGFYRHTGRALKARGMTYLRLDHAGKDYIKGQRGSSAKNDDVDIVWSLEPRDSVNGMRPYVLNATHRRVSWVPAQVKLELDDDADGYLTWRVAQGTEHQSNASGTEALIAELDRLDVPLDVSQRACRALLKDQHISARQAVLVAALRVRRERAEDEELLSDDDSPI